MRDYCWSGWSSWDAVPMLLPDDVQGLPWTNVRACVGRLLQRSVVAALAPAAAGTGNGVCANAAGSVLDGM